MSRSLRQAKGSARVRFWSRVASPALVVLLACVSCATLFDRPAAANTGPTMPEGPTAPGMLPQAEPKRVDLGDAAAAGVVAVAVAALGALVSETIGRAAKGAAGAGGTTGASAVAATGAAAWSPPPPVSAVLDSAPPGHAPLAYAPLGYAPLGYAPPGQPPPGYRPLDQPPPGYAPPTVAAPASRQNDPFKQYGLELPGLAPAERGPVLDVERALRDRAPTPGHTASTAQTRDDVARIVRHAFGGRARSELCIAGDARPDAAVLLSRGETLMRDTNRAVIKVTLPSGRALAIDFWEQSRSGGPLIRDWETVRTRWRAAFGAGGFTEELHPIDSAAGDPPTGAPTGATASGPDASASASYCAHCGALFAGEARFCSRCGALRRET